MSELKLRPPEITSMQLQSRRIGVRGSWRCDVSQVRKRRGLERGVRSGTVRGRRRNNRKKHQAQDHHPQNRDDHNVPVSKAHDALCEISMLSGNKIPSLRFRLPRGILAIVHALLPARRWLQRSERHSLSPVYETRRTTISLQE